MYSTDPIWPSLTGPRCCTWFVNIIIFLVVIKITHTVQSGFLEKQSCKHPCSVLWYYCTCLIVVSSSSSSSSSSSIVLVVVVLVMMNSTHPVPPGLLDGQPSSGPFGTVPISLSSSSSSSSCRRRHFCRRSHCHDEQYSPGPT